MPRGKRVLWLGLFAVAMGLLEAAVVVYLRELYYPGGFRFPLVPLPRAIAAIEIAREACTIVMLAAVASLAARDATDRFFVFAFLFGVWDLLYYVGLLGFLGWPESLLTWDILFLIPVPWLGPVAAPVLVSALLVTGFVVHERIALRGGALRPRRSEWGVATAGAVVVVVAFCWRYRAAFGEGEPSGFPWPLFAVGLAGGVGPLARAARRGARRDAP